jgi:hypothetical protein
VASGAVELPGLIEAPIDGHGDRRFSRPSALGFASASSTIRGQRLPCRARASSDGYVITVIS